MTFTVQDIITAASVLTAIGAIIAAAVRPFKILKRIDRVTTLTAYEVKLQGDMISTLFSHAISPKTIEELIATKEEYDQEHNKIMFDTIMKSDENSLIN